MNKNFGSISGHFYMIKLNLYVSSTYAFLELKGFISFPSILI